MYNYDLRCILEGGVTLYTTVSVILLSTKNLYFLNDFRVVVRIYIKKYRHTLSEREAEVLTKLSYKNKTIFTPDDVKTLASNSKNVLDWLVRKRWVLKIRKGVYTIAPFEAGEGGGLIVIPFTAL